MTSDVRNGVSKADGVAISLLICGQEKARFELAPPKG